MQRRCQYTPFMIRGLVRLTNCGVLVRTVFTFTSLQSQHISCDSSWVTKHMEVPHRLAIWKVLLSLKYALQLFLFQRWITKNRGIPNIRSVLASRCWRLNTLRTGSFKSFKRPFPGFFNNFNPLNAELNPICYLLALLAHHFLHVNRIRAKSLTLRLLMWRKWWANNASK